MAWTDSARARRGGDAGPWWRSGRRRRARAAPGTPRRAPAPTPAAAAAAASAPGPRGSCETAPGRAGGVQATRRLRLRAGRVRAYEYGGKHTARVYPERAPRGRPLPRRVYAPRRADAGATRRLDAAAGHLRLGATSRPSASSSLIQAHTFQLTHSSSLILAHSFELMSSQRTPRFSPPNTSNRRVTSPAITSRTPYIASLHRASTATSGSWGRVWGRAGPTGAAARGGRGGRGGSCSLRSTPGTGSGPPAAPAGGDGMRMRWWTDRHD